MKIYLVVYETGGQYYSTRYFDEGAWNLIKGKVNVIFTVSGKDFEKLEQKAIKQARRRNIPAVANLYTKKEKSQP